MNNMHVWYLCDVSMHICIEKYIKRLLGIPGYILKRVNIKLCCELI